MDVVVTITSTTTMNVIITTDIIDVTITTADVATIAVVATDVP